MYQGILISHTKFQIEQPSDCGEIEPKPLIFVYRLLWHFGPFSKHEWNFSMKFIPKMYQGIPGIHAKFQNKRIRDSEEIEQKPQTFVFQPVGT